VVKTLVMVSIMIMMTQLRRLITPQAFFIWPVLMCCKFFYVLKTVDDSVLINVANFLPLIQLNGIVGSGGAIICSTIDRNTKYD
jgi:hypothetical protein